MMILMKFDGKYASCNGVAVLESFYALMRALLRGFLNEHAGKRAQEMFHQKVLPVERILSSCQVVAKRHMPGLSWHHGSNWLTS